ncbi:helix-turn-helix domain-containing protein [Candidatus Magnetaquicoccus inordinatus]|uniref:helix-turn-helix domain-containing protein n=1 Tax=Candidatus Magnetaquicoccus inordinatus TaxID=2496818 RepID=UPI001D0F28A4|nr:helix-turn-helix transcriptional regulator [Candidatus Magnetaquicoccus inordinatus]
MKVIGHRLKMARQALGMSQRDVCALLNVHTATWNHWETGRRMPDPMVIVEFANSCKVSLDWVYNGQQVGIQFTTELLVAIGQRLRTARSALELHPEEMSATLRIGMDTLDNWENGRSLPDIGTMILLANRFAISLDWIYRGDPSNLPYRIAVRVLKTDE